MGTVLHLSDVPAAAIDAGRWQALNGPLGVTTFGVNAVVMDPGEEIDIEHDETESGHQEVYVVVSGRAAFRLPSATSRPARAMSWRSRIPRRPGATARWSRAHGSYASAPARAPSTTSAPGSPDSPRPGPRSQCDAWRGAASQ